MRRRTGVLLATVALAVAAGVSGCGGRATSAPAEEAGAPSVDQALRGRLPSATRDRGVLVVGTDPSYAPMSSFGRDGRTIVGMEPDLADDLGAVLGLKVEVRQVPFGEVLQQVDDGTIDLGLTAMTDTPERAQQVDFVDYFTAGTAILVQRGNPGRIESLDDLCGEPVAIEKATVQADLLERQQAGCGSRPIRVTEFPTNSDALLRLRTGRTTAVLTDLPPAALLAKDRRTRAFYELATPEQYEPGLYGIAIAKDDAALRSVVADALGQLIDDGHYARTLRRWGLTAGAVKEVQVNSGR
ncbi:ABC transporter substrate-binding protein [Solicola sp. PLA-1-18]|uniref:ABC transporter substrate-binding protein n=1 Tax=Solicola sp. PLA-1-18 TaxID=3380532 RepID=UPI003B7BDFCA